LSGTDAIHEVGEGRRVASRSQRAGVDLESFRPLPLLRSPHLQTILSLVLKRGRMPEPTRQHLVDLGDGDRLVVHDNAPPGWRIGGPVAVVVHGLTGCAHSGGVILQAMRLYQRGARTFRVDLRGAGVGLHLARGSYHAGCSGDLRAALKVVASLTPTSRIVLVGTSLGGNVSLKLAGELAEHPIPALARIAAMNPPIDLAVCTSLISLRQNRVYERHFIDILVRLARGRARRFQQEIPRFPRRLTLREFDDLYTAPRNGFEDVHDYYAKSSSMPFVPRSPIPILILTARDDPFVAVEPIEALSNLSHVEVMISDRGGHTGFLGRDGTGGIGWAETKIAEWLI
jgi:predicted alpha/beta-fold hydrolase